VGSANLAIGGLVTNLEAAITLDTEDDDPEVVNRVRAATLAAIEQPAVAVLDQLEPPLTPAGHPWRQGRLTTRHALPAASRCAERRQHSCAPVRREGAYTSGTDSRRWIQPAVDHRNKPGIDLSLVID
jgi:hypothetical protein